MVKITSTNIMAYAEKCIWSQKAIAKLIGVTPQAMHRYITGESKPSIEKCLMLSAVFGCSVNDLFNYTIE